MMKLFNKQKTTQQAIVISEPRLLRPEPMPPDRYATLQEYSKLARSMDFIPAQLAAEEVLEFFAKNRLPIYDCNSVERYLKQQAKALGKHRNWAPLRTRDRDNSFGGVKETYQQLVPMEALRRIKILQEGLHKFAPKFFISEIIDFPDPFAMMFLSNVSGSEDEKFYIFHKWDEPGFE